MLPLFSVYSVQPGKEIGFCLLACFCFVLFWFCWFLLNIPQNKVEASLQSHCLQLKMGTMCCLLSNEIGSREKSDFPTTISSLTLMRDLYQATQCIRKQTSSTKKGCFSRHPMSTLSMSTLVDQCNTNSNIHHAA